jgi:UDP-N-acetylmuramoyl-tripeptide--D-alanyl-D-alanine ligase
VMERKLSTEQRKKYLNLRRDFKSPVIGITGNVGKTTTLSMIDTFLSHHGKVLKPNHSYGNWKNTINTLEELSPEYDYALFEFEINREDQFGEVLRLIKPNIGVVTNFGDAHLSYLGGMLDIAIKKSEVVKYLARDGAAILNQDDEICSALGKYVQSKNVVKFGLTRNAEFFASNIEHKGAEGLQFLLNGKHTITLPVYSISDVYNFLAAVATLRNLNFDIDSIIGLFQKEFQLPNGRGRLHSINGFYIIDESYNATPRSVAKASRAMIGFKPSVDKVIYILGDMIESGPNVEEQHLNMGYFLSALPIDCLITVGHYAEYIGKGVTHIQGREKIVKSCNSINEILMTLDDVITGRSVITVQGVGQVALRRLITYIEKN